MTRLKALRRLSELSDQQKAISENGYNPAKVIVFTKDMEDVPLAQVLLTCLTNSNNNSLELFLDESGTGFCIVFDDASDVARN